MCCSSRPLTFLRGNSFDERIISAQELVKAANGDVFRENIGICHVGIYLRIKRWSGSSGPSMNLLNLVDRQ